MKMLGDMNLYKSYELKKTIVITSILMLMAYGYVFLNYTPTHDGNMILKTNQTWELSCGRFVVWYYSKIRGNVEAPWLIGILTTVYVSLSVFFTMLCMNITFDNWKIFIVSASYALNIAFISNAGVYIFCFDLLALSLLFAVLGVYFSTRNFRILGMIVAAILYAFSLGMYQSYIAVAIGLYLLLFCKYFVEGMYTSRQILKKGACAIATLFLAGIVYVICIKFFQVINGVEPYQGAYESVSNVFSKNIADYLIYVPNSYKSLFKFYFFQNTYDSIVVNIINAIIFVIGVFSWGYVILKKVNLRWNKVLIVLTLMLMPLGLNCLYVLLEGKMYHMLYFPYQLFYLICFYPIMRTAVDGNNIKLGRFLSIFLVAILSFIIIRFSNDLFYYQKNVGDSSKIAIGNIIYDIERCEGFNKDDNYIIIEGDIPTALQAKYKYSEVYGNVAGVSNLGTTFTYNQTMIWYLKEAIGKDYMFEESPEIRDKIIRSKEAVNMPCYPSVGYARMIDGYLLLKFTDELNQ